MVGSIYRHPSSNCANFIEAFNGSLAQLLTSNIKLFVLGDLNFDISGTNRTSIASNYLNIIQSYGLLPLITKPTRVTETTSTILDHILTINVHHCILPGIIQYDLSDHYPIFCTVFDPLSEKCEKFGMKQMARDLTSFRQDNFISNLEESLFKFNSNLATKQINYHSFNEIFKIFIQIINNVINKRCPNKLLSRKKQRLNKRPWITKDILNSAHKKQKMYKTHFLNGNNESRLFYKKFANKLNKTKFAAKKRCLLQQFDQNKSNPRKTWKVINSLLTKTKSNYTPTRIQVNDNVLDSTSQIAENFNNYFCNIEDNIMNTSTSNSINHFFVHHKSFLQKRVQESLFMEPNFPSEVYNAQAGLKAGKSSGLDNIPSFLLKTAAAAIAPTLSYFINLLFELGLFPGSTKEAKIIPAFKTGDKLLISNYRSIYLIKFFKNSSYLKNVFIKDYFLFLISMRFYHQIKMF